MMVAKTYHRPYTVEERKLFGRALWQNRLESERARLGIITPVFFPPKPIPTQDKFRVVTFNGPPWTSPATGQVYFPQWFTSVSRWKVQPKPYKEPLPYSRERTIVLSFSEYGNNNYYATTASAPSYDESALELAYNKAYSKVVTEIGDQSQWAVNLFEYKQAVSLVERRSLQVYRLFKAVKSLNVSSVIRAVDAISSRSLKDPKIEKLLRYRNSSSHPPGWLKRASKSGSNAWLELHFAVEPALKDIEAAVKTLNTAPPRKRIRAKGVYRSSETVSLSGYVTQRDHDSRVSRCMIGMDITVSNPNTFLASQLGIVNPASFAWEVLPWSFVLDWFGNVGQYLQSYSDFMGLDVSRSFTTFYQVNDRIRDFAVPAEGSGFSATFRSVFNTRTLGFRRPFLRFTPFRGFSVVRGATALSLALQQLHRA